MWININPEIFQISILNSINKFINNNLNNKINQYQSISNLSMVTI